MNHKFAVTLEKKMFLHVVCFVCGQVMVWKLEKKSFRWKFIESLEPPHVVHARVQSAVSKENMYGQVTVRFHSRQVGNFSLVSSLAIYHVSGIKIVILILCQ